MPSYPEGTHQWAEAKLIQLTNDARQLLDPEEEPIDIEGRWWMFSFYKIYKICDCCGEESEHLRPADKWTALQALASEAQDAPREVQDRFFSRVRRYELKIEHVVDREFDDEAEWCRCGAKS